MSNGYCAGLFEWKGGRSIPRGMDRHLLIGEHDTSQVGRPAPSSAPGNVLQAELKGWLDQPKSYSGYSGDTRTVTNGDTRTPPWLGSGRDMDPWRPENETFAICEQGRTDTAYT
eukprot:1179465-Prorocentrum_minimum.AAC.17